MGVQNCSLDLCATSSRKGEDKESVLNALGIGPMKEIKREQMLEDYQKGKLAIKQASLTSL